ncbi:7-cyano-7-deazaguanine synthase [Archangium sp. Cb G35]|uniref:7-cyano-7-deazaguanine synthase n=1 Tax=Archangium sp. Cb G35 TaxID=1920190 RepID=UPI0009F92F2A|nr:7-cyano-7-deazaguanine synthase [Archangium sp. Cb G35]
MSTFRYTVGSFGEVLMHPSEGKPRRLGRIRLEHEPLTWLGQLRPIARDLLHVATAVHHVDRIAPRSVDGDQASQHHGRPRRIELEVGVAEPGHLNGVRPALEKFLHWLTDDQWTLTLTRSQICAPQQLDWSIERLDGAEEVALFSGGLDSVAGAYTRLQERGRPLYLLSSLGTSVREHFLKETLSVLKLRNLQHRWIGFRHQLRTGQGPLKLETPNRTRGFLFLSAAAVAADALGINTVATYECGVGALNLPMNAAQTGAQNTHAMHPYTLIQLESILESLLEKHLRLEAPFLLSTKGALCRRVGADLTRLARISNSCDETERNKRDLNEHCGVCTSCLLRRASLYSVLGQSDPTYYRCRSTRRSGQYQVSAFEAQARRFAKMTRYEDLVGNARTVDHAVEYLRRETPQLSREEAQEQVLSLFQRHAAEVLSFYEQQRPRSLPRRPRQHITKQANHDLFRATW